MPSELRCKLRACVRAFVRALRCVKLLRVARLRGEAADEVEVANEVEGEVDEKLCRARGLLKKLLCCPS